MRIVLLSRFPHFDRLQWKVDLLDGLDAQGERPIALVYDSFGLRDQVSEALRRYGVRGATERLRNTLRRAPGTSPGGGSPSMGRRVVDVARERGIPTHRFANHNGAECVALLRELEPDLVLLLGTRILRKRVLEIPRFAVLNPHYSLLPDVRGMNATEWSIWLGKPLGVTIHVAVPEIDQGDILHFEPFSLSPGDDLGAIRRKCQEAATRGFLEVVRAVREDRLSRTRQTPSEGAQYFVMNRALRARLGRRLRDGG